MTPLRLSVMAWALLISSNGWADLRIFDIEPQYQQEVFTALNVVLNPNPAEGFVSEAHGRVERLPSGQLLVNASAETLEQVEQVLQAIRTSSAAPAPRVTLRYWGVLGARAANTIGTATPPILSDVLAELKKVHGELTFRVIGSAAVVTQSGQYGEVEGATLSVSQTAHVQGDTLSADISMDLDANAPPPLIGRIDVGVLDLRTTLQRGDFVVLGESHIQSGGGLDGPVFYIVHWAEE